MITEKAMGKAVRKYSSGAIFPIADSRKEMPVGYKIFIQEIISDIKEQKVKTF